MNASARLFVESIPGRCYNRRDFSREVVVILPIQGPSAEAIYDEAQKIGSSEFRVAVLQARSSGGRLKELGVYYFRGRLTSFGCETKKHDTKSGVKHQKETWIRMHGVQIAPLHNAWPTADDMMFVSANRESLAQYNGLILGIASIGTIRARVLSSFPSEFSSAVHPIILDYYAGDALLSIPELRPIEEEPEMVGCCGFLWPSSTPPPVQRLRYERLE